MDDSLCPGYGQIKAAYKGCQWIKVAVAGMGWIICISNVYACAGDARSRGREGRLRRVASNVVWVKRGGWNASLDA